MPIDTEKVGDPASRKGAVPFGEDAMKNSVTEELVQAIEKLSEDKKRQVAEFIYKLEPRSKAPSLRKLTPSEKAEINAFTERMRDMAKDYPEFDVLELMEDMRR